MRVWLGIPVTMRYPSRSAERVNPALPNVAKVGYSVLQKGLDGIEGMYQTRGIGREIPRG